MSFSSCASAGGHKGVWKLQAREARVYGRFCALLDEAAVLRGRSTTSTHREPIALCVREVDHDHDRAAACADVSTDLLSESARRIVGQLELGCEVLADGSGSYPDVRRVHERSAQSVVARARTHDLL